jgi:hypothetical protein
VRQKSILRPTPGIQVFLHLPLQIIQKGEFRLVFDLRLVNLDPAVERLRGDGHGRTAGRQENRDDPENKRVVRSETLPHDEKLELVER